MEGKVIIIGTSHIASQSVRQVRAAIKEAQPDIVAVELDHRRFHSLMSGKQGTPGIGAVRQVGVQGYLFILFAGFIQRHLGKQMGVLPGSEMKAAILAAKKQGSRIALIDQDIAKTMQRFSKQVGWTEKWHFIQDLFLGLVGRGEGRKIAQHIDLRNVPADELLAQMLELMKGRYPNTYHVLVLERNRTMAANIRRLLEKEPGSTIVVVMGAAHKSGVEQLLAAGRAPTTYTFTVGG